MTIQMVDGIVGRGVTYELFIDKDDVKQVLSMDDLDIAWIQLAIL